MKDELANALAINDDGRDEDLFDLNALLHPAQAFDHPLDVVRDTDLTLNEKRAILSSWASDACAVEAAPEFRRVPGGKVIRYDEVMDALKRLDGEAVGKPAYGKFISRARRWKNFYRGDRPGPLRMISR
jgi:hypothetical protein